MASSVDDLGRLNSIIRNVAIDGYIYGLVGRKSLDQTHVEIFGTEILHEFMIAYQTEFFRVMQLAFDRKSGAGQ
jgi:hypothetical protein